jgi:ATP-binding cassette, subfamily B, bacterial MsbA
LSRLFFNEVKNVTLRQALIKNILNAFVSPLSIFFIVIVFAVSYAQPGFNLAVFAATIYLIQRIFIHVHTTQKSIHTINDFVPYLVNVASMENKIEKHLEVEVGEKPFTFNDTLEFKNIKFAYNENNPVLREVNLTIQKGKMIGIIGPSGSGKTTFVDLLLRLFDPQSGSIILDGVDANEIKLGEWRRRIEYVPQDIFLLNDTVSNNIRFYDGNITDSDVMRAAKMANIHDFIDGLKNKFDTVIGERGVLLSGGQKQRVVLARALARRPDILVLDEATSALDNESENIIKETLEKLRGEITFIVIAHRLSTVMNADKIVVLDGGKIIEEGNPSDLMQKDNSYLYRTYHTSYN